MSVLPPPILFLAWLGALIPRVGVALEEPAQPAIDQRQIQAATLLDEAIDADQGSGIAAAVMVAGELRFSGAAGLADVEGGRAMTAQTPARIGSVSKILTTALVLRLIDAGKLSADSDIHALVPEFAHHAEQAGRAITPRLLASHTSGIRHYNFSRFAEANNQTYYPELPAALALFANDPLLAKPGAAFHYSSFGFNLLGVAAARVQQSDFGTAMDELVSGPLGLRHTGIDHPLQIVRDRAGFYTVFHGQLINTYWRDSSDYYPSGGMLSSAEDLARLANALFEGPFLSDAARQLMMEPSDSDQGATGYSFGWQLKEDRDGRRHYEHGGETNGAYAWIYFDPSSRTAIAGVANYNVFPSESEVAFYRVAMHGLRDLYVDGGR